jgi:hypothetical protein
VEKISKVQYICNTDLIAFLCCSVSAVWLKSNLLFIWLMEMKQLCKSERLD